MGEQNPGFQVWQGDAANPIAEYGDGEALLLQPGYPQKPTDCLPLDVNFASTVVIL
jgi:hypothetical protein